MNLFSINSYIADQPKKKKLTGRPVIITKIGSTGVAYGSIGTTISRTTFDISPRLYSDLTKAVLLIVEPIVPYTTPVEPTLETNIGLLVSFFFFG